jgi:inorganic pyrophosphatase
MFARACLFVVGIALVAASKDFFATKGPSLTTATFDKSKLEIETVGEHPGLDFRVFYNYDGKRISPWHDIPVYAGEDASTGRKTLHFICEIPKGTTAKMEVNKEHEFNPIAQDLKKGKLRFYKYNPEVGSICNYGAIMQTWEDPSIADVLSSGGDNDPLDVLQINSRPCKMGELYEVKVLGTLAMVDDGETDWKLLVADVNDDATKDMKDVEDIPVEQVNELREWFRLYKTAEGKGENKFGLDEKAMPADYTMSVVADTHAHWKALMKTNGHEEL